MKILWSGKRFGVLSSKYFFVENNRVKLWPGELCTFRLWGLVCGTMFVGVITKKKTWEETANGVGHKEFV